MSMFTSTIDYLLHQRKPVEIDFDRSLARLRASSNASKLAVMEGNAGALSKQVHMEADNALQVTERNTFQKANTYMQFQEEGIKYANILYSQMATLALRASDPDMSKSERAVLASQFNELREIALDLNYETFTDYYLFDPRSSTTDFSEASNWEIYWKRHQAFKPDGKIDIATAAYGGKFIEDGEAEEELAEKLYNAPLTTASASGDTQSEGRSITRDVVYNEGIIELALIRAIWEKYLRLSKVIPTVITAYFLTPGNLKPKEKQIITTSSTSSSNTALACKPRLMQQQNRLQVQNWMAVTSPTGLAVRTIF